MSGEYKALRGSPATAYRVTDEEKKLDMCHMLIEISCNCKTCILKRSEPADQGLPHWPFLFLPCESQNAYPSDHCGLHILPILTSVMEFHKHRRRGQ